MRRHPNLLAILVVAATSLCVGAFTLASARADDGGAPKEDARFDTSGLQSSNGFFNFYWDNDKGQLWLELKQFDTPFLYVNSLASGLGSNPVGLDRGQLGDTRVVRFHRVANRVFLMQENLKYRATSPNEPERRAVRDSFAASVIWGADLKATKQGTFVVEMSDFLLRDAHDCIGTLKDTGQGAYSLAKDRCFLHLPRCKSFPKNTELEASLTFTSRAPGPLARRVAADGGVLTMRQHHSFVELPDGGYTPRKFDPRAGGFAISFSDYAAPIDAPLEQRFIARHRLKKRNPRANISPPLKPIVYYVDPGVPEPILSALIDGAKWWDQAFREAGFVNAFQVKKLPASADPMDVRYNVIQWVHRATRGWSYGSSVVDPRTGEIIKGHVSLGSLRVRQDHLLMEGLRTAGSGAAELCNCCGLGAASSAAYLPALAPHQSSVEVALARIRQLSAHEVGHTLGFAHNFAASTYADRASVMDYPAPRVKIKNGQIDLSDAYGVGVGAWDKFAVKYAYIDVPPELEAQTLAAIVQEALDRRMIYISDADARPNGAAHPLANLWDNGAEPVQALRHEMNVRRIALGRFNESVIPTGQPLGELEKAFTPVYLHHRYQVQATAKVIGGVEYTYAVKGDGQIPTRKIPVEQQRAALAELLKTIAPESLLISPKIEAQLAPRVYSSASDRERFESKTSPLFDPGSAMRIAADLTLASLLQPQRATRLAAMTDKSWDLAAVVDQITDAVFADPAKGGRERQAQRTVQVAYVQQLTKLCASNAASSDARAIAQQKLNVVLQRLDRMQAKFLPDSVDLAHLNYLSSKIRRFQARPHGAAKPYTAPETPPGSPIGQ